MTLQQLYLVLLAGGLVLLASIVATRAATTVGLPALLLFLGVGVIVGEDGIGLHFENYLLADHLGTVALAIILIEGGLTTRFSDIRRVLAPAGILATVGVGVSMAITAAGAHLLLGMDWQLALLLGAIVSVTDAAAVFSVLRVVPLPRRLAGMLEAESGFNDAPAVILVLMFCVTPLELSPVHVLGELVYELGVGAAIGLGCGLLGSIALRRIALPASGLYPFANFGIGMVAFAAAGSAHASGFLACYLAAVVLANSGLPHRSATRSFAEGLGWLAQIGLFVLLGLLVDPSDLGSEIVPAIIIGLVLLLIARPAVGRRLARRVPRAVEGAGVPVVGRTSRRRADRAGDVPDRRGRARRDPAAQHRVHPGRGLHPVAGAQPGDTCSPAGADPEGGHPRDPGGGRAAGCFRGGVVDDDGAFAVAAARRHRAGAAVARPQCHHLDHPRTGTRSFRSRRPGSRRATSCSSSPPRRRGRPPNAGCAR